MKHLEPPDTKLDARSHASNSEERATRVGMLWIKLGKNNKRLQHRFVLFDQVALRTTWRDLTRDVFTPLRCAYACTLA